MAEREETKFVEQDTAEIYFLPWEKWQKGEKLNLLEYFHEDTKLVKIILNN